MNWTGGTLQRTKHANRGMKQKQRAYFARARTKLLQSPNTPALRFRPDFIREGGDREFGHRISPFALGSLCHAGHSASKSRSKGESHTSPTSQRQRHDKCRGLVERENSVEARRKQTDTDIEIQLLEANKRRLLKQQDWVGTACSKPVDLQCSSNKGKVRVEKRRRLVEKSRAATCRRSPVTFLHQSGEVVLWDRGDTLMSGALPALTTADRIRVRIGSDALTTAASTQPIRDAPSAPNSDSMLFDEEDGAVWRKESEAPQGVPSSARMLTTNLRMFIEQPAKIDKKYSPKHGPPTYHVLVRRSNVHADEGIRHTSADPDAFHPFVQPSEAPDPCHRLTHRVGGIEYPLKLTSSGRSTARIDHTMPPTDKPGETRLARTDLHAEEIKAEHAFQNVGEARQMSAREYPNPPSIDDDEPWRPYLDTGTSSSGRVHTNDWTGMSVPQPHVYARNPRAERTDQPQYSVQGNLTHVNLLTVSASLPTSNRRSARLLDARPLPRADAVKGFGIDEAVWQSFALGSDPQSAIETIHTQSETSEDSTSRATKGYASTWLPLSTAVTSVSSTPLPSAPVRSLSGKVPRISDDVQYAPWSGSRSITAAPLYAVWGGVESPHGEDVPVVEQGDRASAGSHFGEQSTHASLQNYASHVNEMLSDTRSSRGDLDQHSRAPDDVSRLAQASGSSVWQQDRDSSIWDIADSDGAGIDLVDADRLT